MLDHLINVNSEIGKLKVVMVHRPSKEIENFTPEMMHRILFDETPDLWIAQKEHDYFAKVLKDHGTKVLYIEQLAAQSLTSPEIKNRFLERMLNESGYPKGTVHDALKAYLFPMASQKMINTIIAGVRKTDVDLKPVKHSFDDAEHVGYPFYMDPMPNLYFTRDTSACIGNGLSINRMTFPVRRRESLFNDLIIKHHPLFKSQHIPLWRTRNHYHTHIEGGDEEVLNNHVMAIGISQRTSIGAIKGIALRLFKHSHFDTILTVLIPHNHALMHLDTVFTMINYDQFTVYPGILKNNAISTWTITPDGKGGLHYQYDDNLKRALKRVLHLDEIDLIMTGNGDPIVAPREQWNDGTNTLAIAPGVVVTYDRNYVSNLILEKHGLNVITIPSSELSRGRGGPRCMSCPIYREDLKQQ